jgi:predicted DNA-binding protein
MGGAMSEYVKISFDCPRELAEKLKNAAFDLDRTKSEIISTAANLGLPLTNERPDFIEPQPR